MGDAEKERVKAKKAKETEKGSENFAKCGRVQEFSVGTRSVTEERQREREQ